MLSEAPLDLETELAWGFLDYLLLGTSALCPCTSCLPCVDVPLWPHSKGRPRIYGHMPMHINI